MGPDFETLRCVTAQTRWVDMRIFMCLMHVPVTAIFVSCCVTVSVSCTCQIAQLEHDKQEAETQLCEVRIHTRWFLFHQ